jgi:hypothetical protein
MDLRLRNVIQRWLKQRGCRLDSYDPDSS